MQFLNPIWLWGLTGLLIPIGIHLLSRKEGKVIRMGSIRHLEETSTRQFRNIRLNEFVLLALRCLLITLIVLLLSGLSFNNFNTKDINYLLLEKGMEHERDFKRLIDSLEQKGFEVRWLAKDFPLLKDSAAIQSKLNYWSLMESLKKEQAQQVVVLSYSYVNGFKGKRTAMPANVHWISKNAEPTSFILNATRLANDSVLVRKGTTSAEGTNFSNEKVSSLDATVNIRNQDTLSVVVYSDDAFAYDAVIMQAALKAVDETLPCVLNITTNNPAQWNDEPVNWIIWLSENKTPQTNNTNIISYSGNEFTDELLTQSDKGWLLTKRLDQENALANNLALQLASILLPKDEAQQRASELDRRTLPEKQLWSSASAEGMNTRILAGTSSARPYLLGLILIALLAERIIALNRNQ